MYGYLVHPRPAIHCVYQRNYLNIRSWIQVLRCRLQEACVRLETVPAREKGMGHYRKSGKRSKSKQWVGDFQTTESVPQSFYHFAGVAVIANFHVSPILLNGRWLPPSRFQDIIHPAPAGKHLGERRLEAKRDIERPRPILGIRVRTSETGYYAIWTERASLIAGFDINCSSTSCGTRVSVATTAIASSGSPESRRPSEKFAMLIRLEPSTFPT